LLELRQRKMARIIGVHDFELFLQPN
jgi:hypothetical protein